MESITQLIYSILARGDNTIQNTQITFRLLHNTIRDKLNIKEQDSDFYKNLADMLDTFDSIITINHNTDHLT